MRLSVKSTLPLLFLISAAACTPEHSTSTGFLEWKANPGYTFTEGKGLFSKTSWTPGLVFPGQPNVISSDTQDAWVPGPGYDWGAAATAQPGDNPYSSRSADGDFTVHWQPALQHPTQPHIKSSSRQGYWIPEKGYVFLAPNTLSVRWAAGISDPDRQHYVSAEHEGQWELAPGYAEGPGWFGATIVAWKPGLPYPKEHCMVSAYEEGKWNAMSGFHVERLANGRYRVVGDERETDWGGVVGGVIAAVVGYSAAQPQQNDSFAATAIGRPIAKEIGNAGVKTALESFGSTNGGSCNGALLADSWAFS